MAYLELVLIVPTSAEAESLPQLNTSPSPVGPKTDLMVVQT